MRENLFIWVCILGVVPGLLGASTTPDSNKNTFTITTLNIKWYGNNGEERRDASLKKFIKETLETSDGILFQEIVGIKRLKSKVMGANYNCYNYEHSNRGHQSVVLCLKKKYTLSIESDDDNWQVDDVSYGSNGARPALSGLIKDDKGRELFHVLGVHLKAFPNKTDVRLMQTEHLADRIETYPDRLPVVLLGDFNSHIKEKTRKAQDDKFLMLDILDDAGMELVDLGASNTWTSKSKRAQLDQIYVSDGVQIIGSPRIDGACNVDQPKGSKDVENYLKNISDHCPVTVDLEF